MQQALSIQKLLDELERLPGIGPKSAQRITYHLLNVEDAEARRLADAIYEVKEYHLCRQRTPGYHRHRADWGVPWPVSRSWWCHQSYGRHRAR